MILASSAKNGMLQGLANTINAGAGTARLTLLADALVVAVFDMPKPIEQSISNGTLTVSPPQQVLATETATPTVAKLVNGDNVEIATFAIGTDLILDSATVYHGGLVNITALSISI